VKGTLTICRKELADHFSSYRFVILFSLILMVGLITTYMAGMNLRNELEGLPKPGFVFLKLFTTTGALFSLVQFVAFFGPLIGLVMGFDAINRERDTGTLSKLLAQPIYRDSIINGKFLAGVLNITVMMTSILLLITGLGFSVLGLIPGPEELIRLFLYLIISIFYISLWLGLAILFSIVFRGIATSAMATLAVWIFFSFFLSMGADIIANAFAPITPGTSGDMQQVLKHHQIARGVSLFSPMELYSNATGTIIDPTRKTTRSLVLMGNIERFSMARFQGPLSLSQSFKVVLPHIVTLTAITLICFGISYLVFMKQEIRSI